MSTRRIPELLAPAGSIDAVRAAVANGANAVYLGAERFNARDEGAQLTLDELEQACLIAHAGGVRVYLTLNILTKPGELAEALSLLGEAIDRGIDAAIVQDLGLVRLIQRVYPGFEIHGSTQMTVHDADGARLMRDVGLERVVLARENTLDDVRAIRAAVPDMGLETFVHGALCISYSGQCFMSGMISERSANRGSCAQSCRKDYVLTDATTGEELDRGYLISAKDLAAHDQIAELAEIGVGCLKVEGRKKKPEYVATVTRTYRGFLDRVAAGEHVTSTPEEVRPLVQIFSRGFTSGMFTGRAGRDYITRTQPDNRGHEIGVVLGREGNELVLEVTHPVQPGDGLGFEPPAGMAGRPTGFAVARVRTLGTRQGLTRQAIATREHVAAGWRVVRSAEAALLERARASYAALPVPTRGRKQRLDVRLFGGPGAPLKAIFAAGDEVVE
ncbi:MAG TPA: peptidase U32 family protein, partial [Gemmatimonadaceae bacterium]|nr:peptidase U32 family protein [Gemmatimonadaceae bacterium]